MPIFIFFFFAAYHLFVAGVVLLFAGWAFPNIFFVYWRRMARGDFTRIELTFSEIREQLQRVWNSWAGRFSQHLFRLAVLLACGGGVAWVLETALR